MGKQGQNHWAGQCSISQMSMDHHFYMTLIEMAFWILVLRLIMEKFCFTKIQSEILFINLSLNKYGLYYMLGRKDLSFFICTETWC